MTAIQVGDPKDHNWSYPGSSRDVAQISIFRPTWDEFKDFNKYLEKIEALGAHKGGLAKIIPPKEWVPRKAGYNLRKDKKLQNLKIPTPICQVVNGNRGIFQSINVQKKTMTVKEYSEHCKNDGYEPPKYSDYEELERKYWKNITFIAPLYGADVCGSITDTSCQSWNIAKLGSILDYVNRDYGIEINGVNTAYLYFGSWKTTFAWHTEDMDLHSINYLHFGDSKFWYCIPPRFMRRFERLADGLFPQLKKECSAFLRHKMCLISPTLLKQHSIPYNKVVQHKGEIIITFPCGYHSGFNTGFNCAESTNFATPRWVEYGKRASRCHCKADMVNISMDCFVKRFQPERYDNWLNGKDLGYHPEDDPKTTKMSIAPPPSAEEFLINKTNEEVPDCILNPEVVGKKKLKRHPIHHGMSGSRSMAGTNFSASKKQDDDDSDSDQGIEQAIYDYDYEALEDIWLKAGEMEPEDATYAPDVGYQTSKRRRHDSSPDDSGAKKTRCGNCKGCLTDNCGKCINCLDMIKFGGSNRLRKACQLRKCIQLGFKPKASKEYSDDGDTSAVAAAAGNKKTVIKHGGGKPPALSSSSVTAGSQPATKTISVTRPTEAKSIADFRPLPVPGSTNNIKSQPHLLDRSPKTFESAFLNFCHGGSQNQILGPMGLTAPSPPAANWLAAASRAPLSVVTGSAGLPLRAPGLPPPGPALLPPPASTTAGNFQPTPTSQCPPASGGSNGLVQSNSIVTSTMLRMDYAKQESKPASVYSPRDSRTSLHEAIQKLKGRLKVDSISSSNPPTTTINKDCSSSSDASRVLNLLLSSGINLQQPIAIIDRNVRMEEAASSRSENESQQFFQLLQMQIQQFKLLTSQLSSEHKQVLQHAPPHKSLVSIEHQNRLLVHLQQLNSQQLAILSAQLNNNANVSKVNSNSLASSSSSGYTKTPREILQSDDVEWRGEISSPVPGHYVLKVQPPPRRGFSMRTFNLSRAQVLELKLQVISSTVHSTRFEYIPSEGSSPDRVQLFFGNDYIHIPMMAFKPDLVDVD